jgi:hypothetical protein
MTFLAYTWSFDIATIASGFTMTGTDDGGAFSVSMTTGVYNHFDISSIVTGHSDFATALETAINAASSSGTYTVEFDVATGYTIGYSGAVLSLDLTGSAGQTNMAAVLGFSGDRTGATSYASQVRPYYYILPLIPARSEMSDEYEPDGITAEAVADDSSAYQLSRATSETLSDWIQAAEIEDPPGSAFSAGTAVFERHATSAVPWSYQHAWRHARTGYHPFFVGDSGVGNAVHMLHADGSSFRPQRMAAKDFGLWNIPFRTRLLGWT